MKKFFVLGVALLLGGGFALAQNETAEFSDGGCGVSACGGGEVTCCYNGSTGNTFFTSKKGGTLIVVVEETH